jgi:hypothetical protein
MIEEVVLMGRYGEPKVDALVRLEKVRNRTVECKRLQVILTHMQSFTLLRDHQAIRKII